MRLFLFLCFLVSLTACDTNAVFKDNMELPDAKWPVKTVPSFSFEISDTTRTYNLYYNLRNTKSYPYYNLYVTRTLLGPDGKTIERKLDELILANATTGKPTGNGLGDIYDHKFLVVKNYRFAKAGTYTFKVEQYMRQDPLPEIQTVGLTVERN
ncbi:gliding motility lipoprotein GldH [Siphonobacter sp. BAB-5385]|uniref:gliding motility lipoprotein GldH n=1 Tax=unclassified Siphonobacter TaxID=2635712 RepID=UPI000B9EA919|nr:MULTISPECIES: gliding motility lipoprotein GldH [unclassified Siphonobacter]OZI05561.1 gliding motility lipoprotein GldH [Siphonobacter sp. BAB-5385]PMD95893.1 gliding motility lipoprotein GldH [Siphonobacter sp. BAB-5405]